MKSHCRQPRSPHVSAQFHENVVVCVRQFRCVHLNHAPWLEGAVCVSFTIRSVRSNDGQHPGENGFTGCLVGVCIDNVVHGQELFWAHAGPLSIRVRCDDVFKQNDVLGLLFGSVNILELHQIVRSTLMISANEIKTSLHSKISLCKGCLRVGESRRTARASAQVGCACARATSWTLAARSGVFARANENFDRKLWAASFVDFRLTLREGRDSRPAQCAGRPSRGAQRPGRFRRPGLPGRRPGPPH
mmetsp:Transcript_8272/g.20347  ORF Transcript_8272/g.20347 Transcript_8272/m.20347 type:complete len:246 (+) Transcript_8272:719-1456(+)